MSSSSLEAQARGGPGLPGGLSRARGEKKRVLMEAFLDAKVSKFLLPLITGLSVIGLAELVHRVEILPKFLTPSPFSVFSAMFDQAQTSLLWSQLWVTLQEGLIGFGIGAGIGLLLGVGIGLSRLVSMGLYPYVVLIQAMPRVVLAPIFIAFLGFGMGPKILTALVLSFFPVMINTTIGLQSVDENSLELMRSMRASRWQTFRKLLLPGALPMIFGGLKTALPLGFVGAIVGELAAANEGIGRLIDAAAFQLSIADMYGYVLWLSLASVALFYVVEFTGRRVVFWKKEVGMNVAARRMR